MNINHISISRKRESALPAAYVWADRSTLVWNYRVLKLESLGFWAGGNGLSSWNLLRPLTLEQLDTQTKTAQLFSLN